MRIHILGICGTLMGSIALLAKQAGHIVSGSDENVYPPMSDQLEKAGIELDSPYTLSSIPPNIDLVVIGNAGLSRGNPALEAVLSKKIPYCSGAEWIGRYILENRWVIAIAGTHGKTTTASMVASILQEEGMSPGYLIGGIPSNLKKSANLGRSPYFVIEADEYDTSFFDHQSKFLHFRPQTLIINNIEYDHADIFKNLAQIQHQFHLLVRKIPGDGQVTYPPGDVNVSEVIARGCWSTIKTFGLSNAELTAANITVDESEFDVCNEEKIVGHVKWNQTGIHNISNALAAISACSHTGIQPKAACEALSKFIGVKRRMELIYDNNGIKVYDDFAHHPTAIYTTLRGLRSRVGKARILAIIDPASHTMKLGTHADKLADASAPADYTIWHQPENIAWQMSDHLEGSAVELISENTQIVTRAKEYITRNHPVNIVIMSNGGFGGLTKELLGVLQENG